MAITIKYENGIPQLRFAEIICPNYGVKFDVIKYGKVEDGWKIRDYIDLQFAKFKNVHLEIFNCLLGGLYMQYERNVQAGSNILGKILWHNNNWIFFHNRKSNKVELNKKIIKFLIQNNIQYIYQYNKNGKLITGVNIQNYQNGKFENNTIVNNLTKKDVKRFKKHINSVEYIGN